MFDWKNLKIKKLKTQVKLIYIFVMYNIKRFNKAIQG